MSIDLEDALQHLNIEESDIDKVSLFFDAANEWIAAKITDTSPAPVQLATLILLEHLWETSQRGPSTAPFTDEIVNVTGTGYAIPNRVLELIGPYRTRPAPSHSFPSAVAFPDPVEWPVG